MVFQLIYHQVGTRSALEAITRYPTVLDQLLLDVSDHRFHVYQDITPLVTSGRFTTQAFVDLLRTASPPISKPTEQLISFWRSRGVLRMDRRGYPDPDCAAAILMARRIANQAQRGWLPAEIEPSEPRWWCWRQDSPTGRIQYCPFPFPEDLPAQTLLWTVWSGAAWLAGWEVVEGGAWYVPSTLMPALVMAALDAWQQPLENDLRTALRVLSSDEVGRALARQTWIAAMTPLVVSYIRKYIGQQ